MLQSPDHGLKESMRSDLWQSFLPNFLAFFLLFSMLQAHWLSCSWNEPNCSFTSGLCTYCSFCLKYLPSDIYMVHFLASDVPNSVSPFLTILSKISPPNTLCVLTLLYFSYSTSGFRHYILSVYLSILPPPIPLTHTHKYHFHKGFVFIYCLSSA